MEATTTAGLHISPPFSCAAFHRHAHLQCRSPLCSRGQICTFRPHGSRSSIFNPRPKTVFAMDASFDGAAEGMPGPPEVFPRLDVRDPYRRLGISRDASEEEIQAARNFLVNEYAGHQRSIDSIEKAYDQIIMESFRARRKTKVIPKKKFKESPQWVKNLVKMYDVPSTKVILLRTVFYALLGVWSVFNSADGGPSFQVAVSLVGCIYFLNQRVKSIVKSLLIGFGSLVIGWVFGSLVVPYLPPSLFPRTWGLELITALISYVFLWFSCTFLK